MKKLSLNLILGAVCLLPFSGASAALLTNLGFETPVVVAPGYSYNTVTTDWVFSGTSGITGNSTAFTIGNPVAPEGVQVAFLQSGAGFYTNGIISQVFTTVTNANMGFTFAAAQRAWGPGAGILTPQNQGINLVLDSVVIGTFTPTGFTYLDYATALVSVLAGTHTLAFVGLNTVGDNTAFIDNLRVTSSSVAIPAPGTLILLVLGFGLLALRSRRTGSVFGV